MINKLLKGGTTTVIRRYFDTEEVSSQSEYSEAFRRSDKVRNASNTDETSDACCTDPVADYYDDVSGKPEYINARN